MSKMVSYFPFIRENCVNISKLSVAQRERKRKAKENIQRIRSVSWKHCEQRGKKSRFIFQVEKHFTLIPFQLSFPCHGDGPRQASGCIVVVIRPKPYFSAAAHVLAHLPVVVPLELLPGTRSLSLLLPQRFENGLLVVFALHRLSSLPWHYYSISTLIPYNISSCVFYGCIYMANSLTPFFGSVKIKHGWRDKWIQYQS